MCFSLPFFSFLFPLFLDTHAPPFPCIFTHFCIPFSPVCFILYRAKQRQTRLNALFAAENTRLNLQGVEWIGSNMQQGWVLQWIPEKRQQFEMENPHRRKLTQEPPLFDALPPDQQQATLVAKQLLEQGGAAAGGAALPQYPGSSFPIYPAHMAMAGPPQQQQMGDGTEGQVQMNQYPPHQHQHSQAPPLPVYDMNGQLVPSSYQHQPQPNMSQYPSYAPGAAYAIDPHQQPQPYAHPYLNQPPYPYAPPQSHPPPAYAGSTDGNANTNGPVIASLPPPSEVSAPPGGAQEGVPSKEASW